MDLARGVHHSPCTYLVFGWFLLPELWGADGKAPRGEGLQVSCHFLFSQNIQHESTNSIDNVTSVLPNLPACMQFAAFVCVPSLFVPLHL